VAYGYRVGEVPLPPLGPIKKSVTFSAVSVTDMQRRPPVNVTLGCHVRGVMEPEPDPSDPMTVAAGVCKRFAVAPPVPDPRKLSRLREFVRRFVRANFDPLPYTADTSVGNWLDACAYPKWRKDELRGEWERCNGMLSEKDYRCDSFIKDETYPEYKQARGINSRSDRFKCKVGPIFRLIEKVVYTHPSFIKKVPVHKRPEYIVEKLQQVGARYFATDYTSFESLFVLEVMEACEFELYDYMTSQLAEHDEFMSLCRGVLGGVNQCNFKFFSVFLEATRMSGEMCTSLGNGFSNLMFMLFLCEEVGSVHVDGVVEGDDGLFVIAGPAPSKKDFESIGLIIKLEECPSITEASFCGIVFDPECKQNLRDPLRVLTTFGWTSRQYANSKSKRKKALLRCKALSLAHQYPGCPIIQALAQYGLRVTSEVGNWAVWNAIYSKGVNEYQRQVLIDAMLNPVDPASIQLGSRLLVERLFRVSVEEQLAVEKYLSGLSDIQELDPGVLEPILSPVWKDYWTKYVIPRPAELYYPGLPTRAHWAFEEVCRKTGWCGYQQTNV